MPGEWRIYFSIRHHQQRGCYLSKIKSANRYKPRSMKTEIPNQSATAQTYVHRFRDGTTATLTLPSFQCQWTGRPSAKLIPEYRQWRAECLEHFHRETGLRIAVIDS
jgi:hypothetical protein